MSSQDDLVLTMLELMPDPVLFVAEDDTVVAANRLATQLTGLSAGDDCRTCFSASEPFQKFLVACRGSSTQIPGRFTVADDQTLVIFGCRVSLPGTRVTGAAFLRIDKRLRLAGKFAELNTRHETLAQRASWAAAEQQRLQELARKDPLTHALNRRAFNERLAEEVERARRYGRPLTLALFDLDHFKDINDT